MVLNIQKPRQALNKAFLKVKANRNEIETFKTNLINLIDRINESESEEFHKNLVSKFLTDTYYGTNHFINTKGRSDLVIYNTNSASGTVGVIVEAKKPTNKGEMLKPDNINAKAFQELVLYYLRERIIEKNLEIKYLVATNIYEWYIFDSNVFEKEFAQNKNLVKQFTDFEEGRLSGKTTDFFYKQIAEPAIEAIKHEISFTHFDIRDYEKPLRNVDKKDDNTLIALFKLLSPQHLLKLPFTNDSNSLDKVFYSELLHIIGLTETKEGSKKLIQRKKEGERNAGSLLESTIFQLDNLDKISSLDKPTQFGETYQERLFNVALELTITWVNRILFLKLLEAQLLKYHKGDKSFAFLSFDKVQNFDHLNNLFFSVLAKRLKERNDRVAKLFSNVPYLNSSLFEKTPLEDSCLFISQLTDDNLPLLSSTVIKNNNGQKLTGELVAIEYIFEFLNAYDFSSEGSEEIQEDNKQLINASVLGLIFEKINGYKDGSIFTPGFITMHMCRETIRRAVVQKFNEAGSKIKGFKPLKSLDDVYETIGTFFTKEQANAIINSLKICDPAVGSGHFLVSTLNEIIAIKSYLKILLDRDGKTLRDYQVEVENDEIIVTDDDGGLFEYNPRNKESQRIQETLFHEKQTIIENCLFGVDINPNSVKICRLRLWIELLKNAYYKEPDFTELETLPNIDINIKCGNSLISRFSLDSDIKEALKRTNSKWSISSYRLAVMTYRNAQSKEEKRAMEKLIDEIKSDFETEVNRNDKRVKDLNKLKSELLALTSTQLFEYDTKQKKSWTEKVNTLSKKIQDIETVISEIKNNVIFQNAFEWRFEFPEVLDDDGVFIGFDAVIGNPPYLQLQSIKEMSKWYEKMNYSTYTSMGDLYALFYEQGNNILKTNGILCFISGSAWMRANYGKELRNFLRTKTSIIQLIDLSDCDIFDSATVLTNILMFEKNIYNPSIKAIRFTHKDQEKLKYLKEVFEREHILMSDFPETSWIISDKSTFDIKSKIEEQGVKLIDWDIRINYGIKTGFNEAFIIDAKTKDVLIAKDPKSAEIIKPLLRGRDIKKYYYEYQDLWLINTHNGTKEKGIKPINIDEFHYIKEYLNSFGSKLLARTDKGDTPFNLRNCAYLEDFEKPKIIYSELTKFLYFSYDCEQKYIDKTAFILTGDGLEYLVSFLNSKLFKYCFANNFSEIQGNTRVLSKVIFEQLPIKKISKAEQQPFIDRVNAIIDTKKQNANSDTSIIEDEIDQLIYKLYDLSEEDILIVDKL